MAELGYLAPWDDPSWASLMAVDVGKINQTAPTQQAEAGPSAADAALTEQRAWQARQDQLRRDSVFEAVDSLLSQFGITSLSGVVRSWANEDKSADWIRVNLRQTDAWKTRFPGLVKLQAAGQFMDEATYIAQERAYAGLLRNYALPEGFYDDPSDFGGWIANGVSVSEVEDRVVSAKTLTDSRYPVGYRSALRDYYGVDEGDLLAYVIDPSKAQSVIQQRVKTAALGGAASARGFSLDESSASKYAATLGDEFNKLGAEQVSALESTFGKLGQQADLQEKYAAIERDSAFTRTDVLDAELLADTGKAQAASKRSKREQARFAGSGGFGVGSLSRPASI